MVDPVEHRCLLYFATAEDGLFSRVQHGYRHRLEIGTVPFRRPAGAVALLIAIGLLTARANAAPDDLVAASAVGDLSRVKALLAAKANANAKGKTAARCRGRRQDPEKGRPAITRSDLLVINKIDLAPPVGASLEIMDRDARAMRGARPFVFTNLKSGDGVARIAKFIAAQGGLCLSAR